MEIDIREAIDKIRTAIDDIKGTLDDDFATDVDTEIRQALRHSVESLLMELPPSLVIPSVCKPTSSTPSWSRATGTMGDGMIVLPDDFLRFLDIQVSGWKGALYELMEAGSEEERRQRSPWSRGSNSKPKAMLDTDNDGKRIIHYWPGSANAELVRLSYVPIWSGDNDKISCSLRDEVEKNVIYRAASIFLEGKKEHDVAENFKVLSTL